MATLDKVEYEKNKNPQNVEKLVSNATHELRTPLNAILGFSSTLLMQLPGPLNKDQLEQLAIIKNSGDQLLALIDEVSELYKLELGGVTAHYDRVNCTKLISNEMDTKLKQAATKGLSFNLKGNGGDVFVDTDPTILHKIIEKLLENAIKFTDKGGIEVTLDVDPIDHSLMIKVADTGIGIKDVDKPKLFTAFTQIKDIGHHNDSAGLGLYLCMRMANLINCNIEYQSVSGAGSCFTIKLPK